MDRRWAVLATSRLTKTPATAATAYSLRLLARRWPDLTEQIQDLTRHLKRLLEDHAPALMCVFGCGPDAIAQLLITAGDNPERLRCEAAFAALTGVSPMPASSGKTNRHRLNRAGDRQTNSGLYHIVIVRLRHKRARGPAGMSASSIQPGTGPRAKWECTGWPVRDRLVSEPLAGEHYTSRNAPFFSP